MRALRAALLPVRIVMPLGPASQSIPHRSDDAQQYPSALPLAAVIALMKACGDRDWETFKTLINRSLPRYLPAPLFDQNEESVVTES